MQARRTRASVATIEPLEPRLMLEGEPVVTVDVLVTTDTTPLLAGTIDDPAATIVVTVDGGDYAAVNDGLGGWTAQVTAALDDAVYDVLATATDLDLNVGTDDTSDELTVDTTDPVVTVDALTTSDSTPTLTGTVTDLTAVTIEIGPLGVWPADIEPDPETGVWTAQATGALDDGVYSVVVTATDALAHEGTDATADELTVDTTDPVVTVDALTTADSTPILTGVVTDLTATTVQIGPLDVWPADIQPDPDTGVWTAQATEVIADGIHSVVVTATDAAGNAGTDPTTEELVIDTTAPVVTVDALITTVNPPTLTGTVTDLTDVTIEIGPLGVWPAGIVPNPDTGVWTAQAAHTLEDAIYSIVATATDALGHEGTDATANELTVDTTIPVVTVDSLTTADSTPVVSGTVTDLTAVTIQIGPLGVWPADIVPNPDTGVWTAEATEALTDGTYDLVVTATDAVGLSGTDSTADELVVDITAPAATVDSLATPDPTPTLTGTVNDADATIVVTVTGSDYNATNNGDGTWTADVTGELYFGLYDVVVTTTDVLGNIGTDGTTDELFIVPELTGAVGDPDAAVVVAVNGSNYLADVAGDGSWVATITEVLADGIYPVHVTIAYSDGTIGQEDTTLVIDGSSPVVTLTALVADTSTPTIAGTVTDVSAIDSLTVTVNGRIYTGLVAEGVWSVTIPTGHALADGTYDVAVTAVDTMGHTGTDATTDELVVDTISPIVAVDVLDTSDATPVLSGIVNDPTAAVAVTVAGVAQAATNNGDGTWTVEIADDLHYGVYDVAATATDAAGNVTADTTTDELCIRAVLTGTVDDPNATVVITVHGSNYVADVALNGTWTVTVTDRLDDGVHDVRVTAAYPDGSVVQSAMTVTIDSVPPAVTVDELLISDSTPTLTGTVADMGAIASIAVTVGGQTYEATVDEGVWSVTIPDPDALDDGTYDVAAVATDAVGHAGADGTAGELVVDTTAPAVTVDVLATADTTPLLTGTVDDPAAEVAVTVHGVAYAAVNDGGGTWTAEVPVARAYGTYDVEVRSTDQAGNVGVDTTTDELAILATVCGTVADPQASVVVSVAGSDYTAIVAGDGTWTAVVTDPLADGLYTAHVTAELGDGTVVEEDKTVTVDSGVPTVTVEVLLTSDTTPQLTGTIDDAEATIEVTVNGVTYAAVNGGDGSWSVTAAEPLADGVYDVSAAATDAVGNAATDATINELTVETQAPTVVGAVLSEDTGPSDSDRVTSDGTPELTVTFSEPVYDVAGNICLLDPESKVEVLATISGWGTDTLVVAFSAPLTKDGAYSGAGDITDSAGNALVGSVAEALGFTLDTTAPAVAGADVLTCDTTPALGGTLSDALDEAATVVEVTVNGVIYQPTTNVDGTWLLADDTIDPPLVEGTYSVVATASDWAGNTTTSEQFVVTIDTTPPWVQVDPLMTSDPTPPLTGLVDPTAVAVEVMGYPATISSGRWFLPNGAITSPLADGVWDVQAVATDAAGNVGVDATTGELTVNAAAPTVTVNALTTEDPTPMLTGTVVPAEGAAIASVTVSVNGTVYTAVVSATSWCATVTETLAVGTYEVAVTAEDTDGAVATDSSVEELTIETMSPQIVTMGTEVTKLTYTDADGTRVTVKAGRGQVAITFIGADIEVTSDGKGCLVTAKEALRIDAISIAADTKSLVLTTDKGGDAAATIEDVTGAAVLGKLGGKGIDLIGGGINLLGGVITSIQLRSIQADVVMTGAAARGVTFKVGGAVGLASETTTISLPASDIKSFTAGSLINADVAAVNIMKVSIKGFRGADKDAPAMVNANVTAQAALGSVNLRNVALDNSGASFGLSSATLKKLSLRQGRSRYTYGKTWLEEAGDFVVSVAEA